MITVMIVDDHPVIRAGLRAILSPYADLTVIAEAASGDEACVLAGTHEPQIILMDLNLGPGMSGVGAIRQILGKPGVPAPSILVLTNMEAEADILNAIEAGATGYLLKDSDPDVLVGAVRLTAQGKPFLDAAVTQTLLNRAKRPSGQNLTSREREVLRLVAEGHSNRAIAVAAHIEEATVKAHLTRIFTKLDVNSRTSAVATARAAGII